MDWHDQLEQLQRQLDEIEAIRAMFPEWEGCESSNDSSVLVLGTSSNPAPTLASASSSGFAAGLLLAPLESQTLSLAQQIRDAAAGPAGSKDDDGKHSSSSGGGEGPLDCLPLLSGTVRPPELVYLGRPVALRFTLPRAYPGGKGPAVGGAGPCGPTLPQGAESGGAGCGHGSGSSSGCSGGGGGGGDGGGSEAAKGGGAAAGAAAGERRPGPEAGPQHVWRAAVLAVECDAPRHVHERLSSVVRGVAEAQAAEGCECLLLALGALQEALEEELTPQRQDADACRGPATGARDMAPSHPDRGEAGCAGAGACASARAADAAASAAPPPPAGVSAAATAEAEGLLCMLVWLHHLKSLTKRKLIVQWARELRLAGACKPGFPGVIVVEGHSAGVREFLSRMRSLSWQAMQVRGEDFIPLPALPDSPGSGSAKPGAVPGFSSSAGAAVGGGAAAARVEAARRLHSPLPFAELDEGGMSQLGALCRDAGLHHVFLTALKL